MTTTAERIITHRDLDLDAVGFAYSARKVFGQDVPVEFRSPTRQEMENPAIIVGDIGVPGCEDIGHDPALNNFDHHYSHANRSATFLFNHRYPALRQDIVDYIDAVDIRAGQEGSELTLKVAAVGIRVRHYGQDPEILSQASRLLAWLEETGWNPGDISGTVPDEIQTYLRSGQAELRRIRQELATMQHDTTDKGRTAGYLVTTSPVFSVVKEEMFTLGLDLAVVYSSTKDRYSIASNVRGSQWVNLKEEGLVRALNAAERNEGMPPDRSWGGHEDRIGSPKPSGSFLDPNGILEIVKATL